MKRFYSRFYSFGFALVVLAGCAVTEIDHHEKQLSEQASDTRDSDVGSPAIAASYFEKGCMKGSAAACDLWHHAERDSGKGTRAPASSNFNW